MQQITREAPDARDLKTAFLQGAAKPGEVALSYTWNPARQDVFLGKEVPTSYLHSLWVGVGMTLINFPGLLWVALVKPLLMLPIGVAISIFSIMLVVVTHVWFGITGRASGIKVNSASYYGLMDKHIAASSFRLFRVERVEPLVPAEIKTAEVLTLASVEVVEPPVVKVKRVRKKIPSTK